MASICQSDEVDDNKYGASGDELGYSDVKGHNYFDDGSGEADMDRDVDTDADKCRDSR